MTNDFARQDYVFFLERDLGTCDLRTCSTVNDSHD